MFQQVFVSNAVSEDMEPEESMDTSQPEPQFQVPVNIKQDGTPISAKIETLEPIFVSCTNEDEELPMETSQFEEDVPSLENKCPDGAPLTEVSKVPIVPVVLTGEGENNSSIMKHIDSDNKLKNSFVKLTDVKFDELFSHVLDDKALLKDLEKNFLSDKIKEEPEDPDFGDTNVTYNLVKKIKPEIKSVKKEPVIKQEYDSDNYLANELTEDNLPDEKLTGENSVISSNTSLREDSDVDDGDTQEKRQIDKENPNICKEQSDAESTYGSVAMKDNQNDPTLEHTVSKIFKCPKCSFESAKEEDLRGHYENCLLKIEEYLCEICGKIISTLQSYALHMFTHDRAVTLDLHTRNQGELQTQINKLKLNYDQQKLSSKVLDEDYGEIDIKREVKNGETIACEEQTTTKNTDGRIRKKIKIDDGKPISCREPTSTDASSRENFKMEKRNKITCKEQLAAGNVDKPICESIAKKGNLLLHKVSKPFKCSKCYYKSATEDFLHVHYENFHSKMEVHKCEICGETVSTKRSYALHLATHDKQQTLALHEANQGRCQTRISKLNCGQPQSASEELKVDCREVKSEIKIGETITRQEQNTTENTQIKIGTTTMFKEEVITEYFDGGTKDINEKESNGKAIVYMEQISTSNADEGIQDNFKISKKREEITCKKQSASENVDSFPCEQVAKDLNNKKIVHQVSKPFKCSKCYFKSAIEDDLHDHYENFHLKIEEHKCGMCREILPTKRSYVLHLSTHDDLQALALKAQQTKINVDDAKRKRFKCRKCDFTDEKRSIVTEHRKKMHPKQKRYKCKKKPKCQCEVCGKLVSDKLFMRHMSLHDGVKPFKCTECAYASTLKYNVDKHYRNKHLKFKKIYVCSVCGYETISLEHSRCHEAAHLFPPGVEVPKPFKCFVCEQNFISKFKLSSHMKNHRLKRCSRCPETFPKSRRACYVSHLREAHGVVQEFKCDLCGKLLYSSHALSNHKRTHCARKYFCNVCGKAFKTRAHIEQHLIAHSDAKPFSCSQCGEKFKRKYAVNLHVTTIHGNKPKSTPE